MSPTVRDNPEKNGHEAADELADARERGRGMLSFSPYVRQVIAKNRDKGLDLVSASQRAQFKLPEEDVQ